MNTTFQFDATVEINEVEVDVVVTGSVAPGSPMVRYYPDGSGDPGHDPEIDGMDVTLDGVSVYGDLTAGQIETLEEKVWDNLPENDDYPENEDCD